VYKDVLGLHVLRSVITDSIGYADMLITMNCYMQLFETGYYLKGAVGVMVSPQTTMPFWGYNYVMLFRMLQGRPDLTVREIGRSICLYFAQKYYEDPVYSLRPVVPEDRLTPEEVAFSANDLDTYDHLNIAFDKVTTLLNDRFRTPTELCIGSQPFLLADIITAARDKSFMLNRQSEIRGIVDIKTFFDNVGKMMDHEEYEDAGYREVFKAFADCKAKTVIAAHQPGRLFEPELVRNFLPIQGPQGVSVFFPGQGQLDVLTILRQEFGFSTIKGMGTWNVFLDNFQS
ncbi:MAG: clostripain-related cysteine peptidase, partial [Chitinophagaceae bacterium]